MREKNSQTYFTLSDRHECGHDEQGRPDLYGVASLCGKLPLQIYIDKEFLN